MGLVIAVDFDGTMVEHDFPRVGKNIGAGPALRLLHDANIDIILYTMRSDDENGNNYLTDAIDWCKNENIPLYGINLHPTQYRWTSSNKCHADICIDDRNFGTPLYEGYVDWVKVISWFYDNGYLYPIDEDTVKQTIKEIKEERND